MKKYLFLMSIIVIRTIIAYLKITTYIRVIINNIINKH